VLSCELAPSLGEIVTGALRSMGGRTLCGHLTCTRRMRPVVAPTALKLAVTNSTSAVSSCFPAFISSIVKDADDAWVFKRWHLRSPLQFRSSCCSHAGGRRQTLWSPTMPACYLIMSSTGSQNTSGVSFVHCLPIALEDEHP